MACFCGKRAKVIQKRGSTPCFLVYFNMGTNLKARIFAWHLDAALPTTTITPDYLMIKQKMMIIVGFLCETEDVSVFDHDIVLWFWSQQQASSIVAGCLAVRMHEASWNGRIELDRTAPRRHAESNSCKTNGEKITWYLHKRFAVFFYLFLRLETAQKITL